MQRILSGIITLVMTFSAELSPIFAMVYEDIDSASISGKARIDATPQEKANEQSSEHIPLLTSSSRNIHNLTAAQIQHSLQGAVEAASNYSIATAATTYSTASRKEQLEESNFVNHNDNINGLLAETDISFFAPKSNLAKLAKGLGGLTHASIPCIIYGSFIVYSLGDLFQLGIDGPGSRALLGTSIAITVPAVARQSYDIIEKFIAIVNRNPDFLPSDGGGDGNADGKPHVFTHSKLHNVSIAGGLLISFVRASVPTTLMLTVLTKGSSLYPWVATPGLLTLFWNTYSKRILKTTHKYFHNSYVISENNKNKRRILISKIKSLKKFIKKDPSLTDKIYQVIIDKINRQITNSTLENEEISAFSTLMVKELVRYNYGGILPEKPSSPNQHDLIINDADTTMENDLSKQALKDQIKTLTEQVSKLQKENEFLNQDFEAAKQSFDAGNNYKIDLETIGKSKSHRYLEEISSWVGHVACYAEMEALRLTMQHILSGWGVNETTAMYTSYSIAALTQALTTSLEKTERAKQYTKLVNFWEELKDFCPPPTSSRITPSSFFANVGHVVTKTYTKAVSFVGGVLYSLPKVVVVNQSLDLPFVAKLILFGSMAIDEFVLFQNEFSENYQDIFRGFATLRSGSSRITSVEKNAILIRWCETAQNYMETFDEETIENIYTSTQQGQ